MKIYRIEKYAMLLILCFVLGVQAGGASAGDNTGQAAPRAGEVPDTTMKLQGGAESTLFESLKIEGEDRIRIEFERPELILNLDPKTAQGLEWRSIDPVLNPMGVSLTAPFLRHSSGLRRQCFARPWLDQFAAGGVARFRPDVKDVESWRLMVADSKGETVAVFEGKKEPPEEIIWDGRSTEGRPVPPGLTYSYVLEAYDRAGNKRNFMGEGFELPAYRIDTEQGRMLLFSGGELPRILNPAYGEAAPPPAILLDVVNIINQEQSSDSPVHIEVSARSFEDADRLARDIVAMLKPYFLGNPLRIQPATRVQPDAPEHGTVVVLLPR